MLKVPVEIPNGPGGSFVIDCVNVVADGPVGYPSGTQVWAYVNPRSVIAIVPSSRGPEGPIPGCFLLLLDGHKVLTTSSADEVAEMLKSALAS